jgi:hypothetical protein
VKQQATELWTGSLHQSAAWAMVCNAVACFVASQSVTWLILTYGFCSHRIWKGIAGHGSRLFGVTADVDEGNTYLFWTSCADEGVIRAQHS